MPRPGATRTSSIHHRQSPSATTAANRSRRPRSEGGRCVGGCSVGPAAQRTLIGIPSEPSAADGFTAERTTATSAAVTGRNSDNRGKPGSSGCISGDGAPSSDILIRRTLSTKRSSLVRHRVLLQLRMHLAPGELIDHPPLLLGGRAVIVKQLSNPAPPRSPYHRRRGGARLVERRTFFQCRVEAMRA